MTKDTPVATVGVNADGKVAATMQAAPVVQGSLAAVAQVFELNRERGPLEGGKMVRLRAVHGDLYHPGDNVRFTVDSEIKHEVDSWVNLQYTFGKLDLVVD
jgi:hypothetical protein